MERSGGGGEGVVEGRGERGKRRKETPPRGPPPHPRHESACHAPISSGLTLSPTPGAPPRRPARGGTGPARPVPPRSPSGARPSRVGCGAPAPAFFMGVRARGGGAGDALPVRCGAVEVGAFSCVCRGAVVTEGGRHKRRHAPSRFALSLLCGPPWACRGSHTLFIVVDRGVRASGPTRSAKRGRAGVWNAARALE